MNHVAAVAILMATITFSAQAELILPKFQTNVETYRVFGQEHPGPYKHPASITQLENGDLYIAYYGGANEYDKQTAVYGSRHYTAEKIAERFKEYRVALFGFEDFMTPDLWTFPVPIATAPFQGVGNPVIWQAPDGLVWLFYNNQHGDTWSNARVLAKISEDGAKTWSDAFPLALEEGSMVRGQPIVCSPRDAIATFFSSGLQDLVIGNFVVSKTRI